MSDSCTVAALRHRRSLLSSTLLSTPQALQRLQRAKSTQPRNDKVQKALKLAQDQHRRNQENAYRLGAGITAFKLQDPDPHAVDGGRVLGIRIEVFDTTARSFLTPYYVFLNKPDGDEGGMRIHKHTLPAHVGLKNFVHRYLPLLGRRGERPPKQDLLRLVSAVRKELVNWQKRTSAIAKLREEACLEHVGDNDDTSLAVASHGISSIEQTDSSAREIEISWLDASFGKILLAKDGAIEQVSVRSTSNQGLNGVGRRLRDREAKITGGDRRVEGVVERLLGLEAR